MCSVLIQTDYIYAVSSRRFVDPRSRARRARDGGDGETPHIDAHLSSARRVVVVVVVETMRRRARGDVDVDEPSSSSSSSSSSTRERRTTTTTRRDAHAEANRSSSSAFASAASASAAAASARDGDAQSTAHGARAAMELYASRNRAREHRCNDRLEDVIQSLFEGNPLLTFPPAWALFAKCMRSGVGDEPRDPFLYHTPRWLEEQRRREDEEKRKRWFG